MLIMDLLLRVCVCVCVRSCVGAGGRIRAKHSKDEETNILSICLIDRTCMRACVTSTHSWLFILYQDDMLIEPMMLTLISMLIMLTMLVVLTVRITIRLL